MEEAAARETVEEAGVRGALEVRSPALCRLALRLCPRHGRWPPRSKKAWLASAEPLWDCCPSFRDEAQETVEDAGLLVALEVHSFQS